ncbi:sigma factor-like helix-turn-helix DNA-binding protein [Jannaschia sp. R86511]|uniref:sigma factor-like helix-turn-helix DNA-binding protein n=1 Tax=Jannaschia sp. R86511 TaxID=3093853 RepID=UPI0036D25C37
MDREVLTLSLWEGLTAVEIGQVLAMPAVSVRSRLHRAKARRRAQLAVDEGLANERSQDSPARR